MSFAHCAATGPAPVPWASAGTAENKAMQVASMMDFVIRISISTSLLNVDNEARVVFDWSQIGDSRWFGQAALSATHDPCARSVFRSGERDQEGRRATIPISAERP